MNLGIKCSLWWSSIFNDNLHSLRTISQRGMFLYLPEIVPDSPLSPACSKIDHGCQCWAGIHLFGIKAEIWLHRLNPGSFWRTWTQKHIQWVLDVFIISYIVKHFLFVPLFCHGFHMSRSPSHDSKSLVDLVKIQEVYGIINKLTKYIRSWFLMIEVAQLISWLVKEWLGFFWYH